MIPFLWMYVSIYSVRVLRRLNKKRWQIAEFHSRLKELEENEESLNTINRLLC